MSLNLSSTQAQSTTPVESTDPVFLITELKVSPSNSEFIEFTNNSNQELEINNLSLEYHSDSSPNYSNKNLSLVKTLPLAMPAGSKLQLSSSTSTWATDSVATFGAGLKDSVGWIKLNVESGGYIYSSYTHWGAKDEPDCTTSPAPSVDQSLKRFVDDQNLYTLSDKQGEDYYISSAPTPLDQAMEAVNDSEVVDYCNKPVPVTPVNPDPPTPNPTGTTQPTIHSNPGAPTTGTYLPVEITEILPDPVSPQTDAEDEYIEIYNPNSETMNLNGYQLQSGNSFSYKYTFDNVELGAGQYLVIYRKDSGLTLANTSGSVRVLDPAGNVLDQTSYNDPDPGASWSKINGSWVYTSSLTPGGANTFAAVLAKTAKTSTKKASTKKASTKKKAAAKKSSTKKASTKKTNSKKSKAAGSGSTQNAKEDPTTKLNSKYIYIAIAVLAIYNLWEYRDSIKRFLLKPVARRKLKLSTSN